MSEPYTTTTSYAVGLWLLDGPGEGGDDRAVQLSKGTEVLVYKKLMNGTLLVKVTGTGDMGTLPGDAVKDLPGS